jgi:hypothetical protein
MFLFISFISRHVKALATHEVNTRWWTSLLAPHFRDVTPLYFFLWGCVKDSVFRNSWDGTGTLHAGV